MQTVNPIDKIRKRLEKMTKDGQQKGWRGTLAPQYVRDVATLLVEIDRLISENSRLKTELTAAAFNSLPF